MAIQRDTTEERQARLDKMITEFRDAQKRALLKRGVTLWNRTDQEQALTPAVPPPDRIN
jgi:hypothetical protein